MRKIKVQLDIPDDELKKIIAVSGIEKGRLFDDWSIKDKIVLAIKEFNKKYSNTQLD